MTVAKNDLTAGWFKIAQTSQHWQIQTITRDEFGLVKELFLKLHQFNASLDPRFALSDEWEPHFAAYLEHSLECRKCLCLLARNRDDGYPSGFVLAAVQQDSTMWKHRDWVEVVALYLEPGQRGQGLAEALLNPVYDWTTQLGLSVVQLYVTAANERAINFYAKEDFRPAQLIMRKALAEAETV